MKTTNQIVKENNKRLTDALIPKGNEPIFCNSVLNPNDEIFNQKIQQNEIQN
jgi:hypothetical protein